VAASRSAANRPASNRFDRRYAPRCRPTVIHWASSIGSAACCGLNPQTIWSSKAEDPGKILNQSVTECRPILGETSPGRCHGEIRQPETIKNAGRAGRRPNQTWYERAELALKKAKRPGPRGLSRSQDLQDTGTALHTPAQQPVGPGGTLQKSPAGPRRRCPGQNQIKGCSRPAHQAAGQEQLQMPSAAWAPLAMAAFDQMRRKVSSRRRAAKRACRTGRAPISKVSSLPGGRLRRGTNSRR